MCFASIVTVASLTPILFPIIAYHSDRHACPWVTLEGGTEVGRRSATRSSWSDRDHLISISVAVLRIAGHDLHCSVHTYLAYRLPLLDPSAGVLRNHMQTSGLRLCSWSGLPCTRIRTMVQHGSITNLIIQRECAASHYLLLTVISALSATVLLDAYLECLAIDTY